MRGFQFRVFKVTSAKSLSFDSAEPITTPLIPKHPESGCFADCHFIRVFVHVITVGNRRFDWQIRDKVKVHLAR